MQRAVAKYKISLPDRQLACAPVPSSEGAHYLSAMACAANFAWANRQMIAHRVRGAFERMLGRSADVLGMRQVYDVAHNIAKIEEHPVKGAVRKLCVHRKGATRAFAPHTPGVPACYQEIGQPVLVPGDMGRYSFVLVGTETAMWETWGSTCHGAGRLLSRAAAMKLRPGHEVIANMRDRGVLVVTPNKRGVAEEQPEAYKDVADVVDVVHGAGLSTRVARMRPLGVVKG